MMKNQALTLLIFICSLVFAGCDSPNNTTPKDDDDDSLSDVIPNIDNLPKCNQHNQGEIHLVGHEETLYFCKNETWQILDDTTQYSITCKEGLLQVIPKELYSDNFPIYDLNTTYSLYGYAQKGPFMIGSSIQVTELDSTQFYRTTQKYVEGCLLSKDGRFELSNIPLNSRFLQVSVNGFYRNEITGKRSKKTLTLKSIVDMNNRDSVNINVLTHLESGRLEQLISTSGGYLPINQAKEQASKDIFKAFEIDFQNGDNPTWANPMLNSNGMHVEDLNLFGNSDSSAALLAISIMLQGDRSEDEITNLMNQIGDDLKGDGYWNDMNLKTKIADWLMVQDTSFQFNQIRNNMSNWNFGPIPNFEKHLRNFWYKTYGFEACNETTAGQVKYVNNNTSAFFASYYAHTDNTKLRFICDASSKMWRTARDIEKDTIGFGLGKYDKEIREGLINTGNYYIYEQAQLAWRLATPQEADGFTDILEIYNQLEADEKVIFVIRHAERTNDTGKDGKLTDNGINQAKNLGASLAGEDFFYASSDFFRASETCRNIAVGKGQKNYKIETWEALSGEWYVLNSAKLETYKGANGGGWQVFSRWAFLNEFSDAFYDLEKRSDELLDDYVFANLSKINRVGILCSHDQLVVPLLAYTTNNHANVRYYENNRWLNYLSGVAIIINSKEEIRYIPIKALETGTM